VERILFAATKADHLHHSQHGRLAALTEALLREARDRAEFAGAETAAMAIASLRTTVEDRVEHGGAALEVVRGRLLDSGGRSRSTPATCPRTRAPPRARAAGRRGLASPKLRRGGVSRPRPFRYAPARGRRISGSTRAAEFLIGDAVRLRPAVPTDAAPLALILGDWVRETGWMPVLHSREADGLSCAGLIGRVEVTVAEGKRSPGLPGARRRGGAGSLPRA
jgi:hypothetical protein